MAEPPSNGRKPWGSRLLWLVVLWAGSVAALGLFAWVLRQLMGWAGLTA